MLWVVVLWVLFFVDDEVALHSQCHDLALFEVVFTLS